MPFLNIRNQWQKINTAGPAASSNNSGSDDEDEDEDDEIEDANGEVDGDEEE